MDEPNVGKRIVRVSWVGVKGRKKVDLNDLTLYVSGCKDISEVTKMLNSVSCSVIEG